MKDQNEKTRVFLGREQDGGPASSSRTPTRSPLSPGRERGGPVAARLHPAAGVTPAPTANASIAGSKLFRWPSTQTANGQEWSGLFATHFQLADQTLQARSASEGQSALAGASGLDPPP